MSYAYIFGAGGEPCPVCKEPMGMNMVSGWVCPTPHECELAAWDWLQMEAMGLPVKWPLGARPRLHLNQAHIQYLNQLRKEHA